jgi:hypothetical protein
MSRTQYISNSLTVDTCIIVAMFCLLFGFASLAAAQTDGSGQSTTVGQLVDTETNTGDDSTDTGGEALNPQDDEVRTIKKRLEQEGTGIIVPNTVTTDRDRGPAMTEELLRRKDEIRTQVDTIKHSVTDRIQMQKERLHERATHLSDRLEAKRVEMGERKSERQAMLAERHQDRILEHVKQLVRRLSAAIERMKILAGRLQSRIDKLTERGLDMTDEQILLDTALDHIASASTDVDAIEDAVIEMLNSDDPRNAFEKVKELVRTTIQSVKDAHKSLVEAIRSVKSSDHSDSAEETNTDEEPTTN